MTISVTYKNFFCKYISNCYIYKKEKRINEMIDLTRGRLPLELKRGGGLKAKKVPELSFKPGDHMFIQLSNKSDICGARPYNYCLSLAMF